MVEGAASLPAVIFWTALWCLWHSLLATHRWRALVQRLFPRWHAFSRVIYVLGSTLTLAVLMAWLRSVPEQVLWEWKGPWALARWLGLAEAAFLFWAGARAFDNRHFLGLAQLRDYAAGRQPAEPPFRAEGILGVIRHPWYSGTLLLLVFMLPWTNVNLAWRGVFLLYTLVGCELEERKLLRDIGAPYAEYRRQVGRYWPRRRGTARS
jgi:protein-S-isoprenylcysteine O-methyltransferase Ste14